MKTINKNELHFKIGNNKDVRLTGLTAPAIAAAKIVIKNIKGLGIGKTPPSHFFPLGQHCLAFRSCYLYRCSLSTIYWRQTYGSVSAGREKCLFYVLSFFKSRKLVWPN